MCSVWAKVHDFETRIPRAVEDLAKATFGRSWLVQLPAAAVAQSSDTCIRRCTTSWHNRVLPPRGAEQRWACTADMPMPARRTAVDNIRPHDRTDAYIYLPGTARDALTFYGDVFGCAVRLHTFEEFDRTDGPASAIAHGYLMEGPVALFAADVAGMGRRSDAKE